MILIRKRSIGQAHEEVIREITRRCESQVRVTEDGEYTWDPEEPVCIHVDEPFAEPMRSGASLFGEKFSEQYQASLYKITPRRNDGTDAVYTYGNRLRDYPLAKVEIVRKSTGAIKNAIDAVFNKFGYVPAHACGELSWKGDGRNGGIDQIQESIIKRLIANPESRRAIAITWFPFQDITADEPPCLQIVQCLIDKSNHLNLVCVFRSNDMLSAWGQNVFGLAHLQKYICEQINLKMKGDEQKYSQGWLETISISAHMYYHRDQLELNLFLDKIKTGELFQSFQRR
ncbi:thymidylate synthase [Methanospirillum sp.]|uniref:thymidylate synthase n=1 Tax=Methanospirillum sp. TaxID=45200 RepID=UPI002984BD51|nr:thymidylate synthase [Methanospirillum sp.]